MQTQWAQFGNPCFTQLRDISGVYGLKRPFGAVVSDLDSGWGLGKHWIFV